MSVTDSYAVLAERLEYPGSERLVAILKYWLTPVQARIAEELPGTPSEVAERIGLDASRVREELDSLFVKGVVFPRGDYNQREYFRFARGAMQLHDASQACKGIDPVKDRRFYELWQDFVINELYPRLAKAAEERGQARSRVVPAYLSIRDLPDVLPYENIRELVKAQERISVVPCSCRLRMTAVGEHCSHTSEEERWNCLQFNRSADYSLVRGAGKELTTEETLDLVDKMEQDGLIHIWGNANMMVGHNVSCHCCRDCCVIYGPMDQAGLSMNLCWEKSRYAAFMASTDACDGCQDCVDRCQFDAIEMAKVPGSRRLKATVAEESCFGCGVCVVGCEQGALKMKVIRPVEHIPTVGAIAGH